MNLNESSSDYGNLNQILKWSSVDQVMNWITISNLIWLHSKAIKSEYTTRGFTINVQFQLITFSTPALLTRTLNWIWTNWAVINQPMKTQIADRIQRSKNLFQYQPRETRCLPWTLNRIWMNQPVNMLISNWILKWIRASGEPSALFIYESIYCRGGLLINRRCYLESFLVWIIYHYSLSSYGTVDHHLSSPSSYSFSLWRNSIAIYFKSPPFLYLLLGLMSRSHLKPTNWL